MSGEAAEDGELGRDICAARKAAGLLLLCLFLPAIVAAMDAGDRGVVLASCVAATLVAVVAWVGIPGYRRGLAEVAMAGGVIGLALAAWAVAVPSPPLDLAMVIAGLVLFLWSVARLAYRLERTVRGVSGSMAFVGRPNTHAAFGLVLVIGVLWGSRHPRSQGGMIAQGPLSIVLMLSAIGVAFGLAATAARLARAVLVPHDPHAIWKRWA